MDALGWMSDFLEWWYEQKQEWCERYPKTTRVIGHVLSPLRLHPTLLIVLVVTLIMKGTDSADSIADQCRQFVTTFLCDGSLGLTDVFWRTAPLALAVAAIVSGFSLRLIGFNLPGLFVCVTILVALAGLRSRQVMHLSSELRTSVPETSAPTPGRATYDATRLRVSPPLTDADNDRESSANSPSGLGLQLAASAISQTEEPLQPGMLIGVGTTLGQKDAAARVSRHPQPTSPSKFNSVDATRDSILDLRIHSKDTSTLPKLRILAPVQPPAAGGRVHQDSSGFSSRDGQSGIAVLGSGVEIGLLPKHAASLAPSSPLPSMLVDSTRLSTSPAPRLSSTASNQFTKAAYLMYEYLTEYGSRLFASSIIVGAYVGIRFSAWLSGLMAILTE